MLGDGGLYMPCSFHLLNTHCQHSHSFNKNSAICTKAPNALALSMANAARSLVKKRALVDCSTPTSVTVLQHSNGRLLGTVYDSRWTHIWR
jgi:hypothetical protein